MAWQDLFVRTDVSETSPVNRRGGVGSPDIIPVGTAPSDWQTYASASSYGRYYNSSIYAGKPNYIYVRAKNAATADSNMGQAYLVMSNPAVVLWPGGDGWTRIPTNDGSYASNLVPAGAGAGDSDPPPVGPGQIAVTKEPFVFAPNESGHRCLVTWLSTQQHRMPEPPPKITTIDDLARFLIDHPNYAHHNIDIAPNTTGAVTKQAPFASGTIGAKWTFGLRCTGAKGFTVSFSSGDPLPNGKYVTMAPTTINQNDTVTYSVDGVGVGPGWTTTFNYTYETNSLTPPSFAIDFVALHEPDKDHPLYARAFTAPQLGFAPSRVRRSDYRAIPVGSIGVMKGSSGGTP